MPREKDPEKCPQALREQQRAEPGDVVAVDALVATAAVDVVTVFVAGGGGGGRSAGRQAAGGSGKQQ